MPTSQQCALDTGGTGVAEVAADIGAGPRAVTSVPVHPLIAARWSPREFDSTEVSEGALRAMFESARWAPSFGNTQPARYLLGRRGDGTFQRLLTVLTPANRRWAGSAAALILGLAATSNAKGPLPYAEYGLALATENLVLQAVADGFAAHQMAGFDRDAARAAFGVPADHEPLIVVAVGRPVRSVPGAESSGGDRPRRRKPLAELVGSDWDRPAFP